jgi:hypothetical protein
MQLCRIRDDRGTEYQIANKSLQRTRRERAPLNSVVRFFLNDLADQIIFVRFVDLYVIKFPDLRLEISGMSFIKI